ncbi:MAG: hypothetical protein Q7J78_05740 [Clostridiales bacterium]|nr:hypothetical protein [Clostridiales bacterium]
MVSDRGSTPLASTIESTSSVETSEAGLPKVSCFLSSKDKNNEAELFGMITATESRDEINSYLYKVELVAKYLPHLNIFEQMGRTGRQYSKKLELVKL